MQKYKKHMIIIGILLFSTVFLKAVYDLVIDDNIILQQIEDLKAKADHNGAQWDILNKQYMEDKQDWLAKESEYLSGLAYYQSQKDMYEQQIKELYDQYMWIKKEHTVFTGTTLSEHGSATVYRNQDSTPLPPRLWEYIRKEIPEPRQVFQL